MKNLKRIYHVMMALIVLISIPYPLFSAFKDSGWGVRPLGMAGAFTAVADDSNAPFYNPAGLPQVPSNELSLMSAKLFSGLEGVDIGLSYLSYVHPMGKAGSLGIAWGEMSSPSLYSEDRATVGYGRSIKDLLGLSDPDISLGANVKYLKHEYTLDVRTAGDIVFQNGRSAGATSADIGVLVCWKKTGLNFAVVSKDINSPNVGLLTVDKVPNENIVAAAYYNEKLPYLRLPYFTSALDFVSRESETDVRFGLETWLLDGKFAVRSGASQEDITVGLGYEIKLGEQTKLLIDYAFAWPLQVENSSGSHRFGLSIKLP